MEILVKSGGFSHEKGYAWVSKEPSVGGPIGDSFLSEFGIGDLFDDRSPSVLLARRSGELLLLVTLPESSRWTDYRGRYIRNMVAWRCGEDEEGELRSLAVLALENSRELEKKVDEAVTRDDQSSTGFKVDWEQMRAIRGQEFKPRQAIVESDSCQFAKNSEERRDELTAELKAGRVPSGDRPLIVVTGIVGLERLEARQVWRGLTLLVPWVQWGPPETKKTAGVRNKGLQSRLVLTLFGLLSVGAAILFTIWLTKPFAERMPPKAIRLVINAQGGREVSRWTPGTDARWKILRPKGTVTLTVTFDEPMDVTTAPSVTSSLAPVTVSSIAWSSDGTSCSFQITLPGEEVKNKEKAAVHRAASVLLGGTPNGLFACLTSLSSQQPVPGPPVPPFTLRVSGGKDRNGNQMQSLEIVVAIIDR